MENAILTSSIISEQNIPIDEKVDNKKLFFAKSSKSSERRRVGEWEII
jgi:hypothetical protein